MSALKFQKARPGLYHARRNDLAYEIEKVPGFGWQLRHGSAAAYDQGATLDPIGGMAARLSTAKQLALQHLSSNV